MTGAPLNSLVIDRCSMCGEFKSDELIRVRDRTPCDNCDFTTLPPPWSYDDRVREAGGEFYDDCGDDDGQDYPAPRCQCGSYTFVLTFRFPSGSSVNLCLNEDTWCFDHGSFHCDPWSGLTDAEGVAEAQAGNENPQLIRSACNRCNRDHYVEWDLDV